ncbi:TPA: hypothetical protein ACVGJE_005876 [Pseudomonas aeruginosa]
MKKKAKIQVVVTALLATALTGCFEPSGKSFEGAWIDVERNSFVKPALLDITCDKGFCEVQKTIWYPFNSKYSNPEISNARIENEGLLVWEGNGGSAKFKDGKIYWNSDVYERRE